MVRTGGSSVLGFLGWHFLHETPHTIIRIGRGLEKAHFTFQQAVYSILSLMEHFTSAGLGWIGVYSHFFQHCLGRIGARFEELNRALPEPRGVIVYSFER
jgi:hypothetical protein